MVVARNSHRTRVVVEVLEFVTVGVAKRSNQTPVEEEWELGSRNPTLEVELVVPVVSEDLLALAWRVLALP